MQSKIILLTQQPLLVISKGHGSRQSRRTNDRGFPALITKKCKITGKEIVQRNADGTIKTISPKNEYAHISAGDIIRFEIKKVRSVKSNHQSAVDGKVIIEPKWYTTRVKTPNKNGFEVLIKGGRVGISSMKGVKFAYRADGYEYKFS